MTNFIRSNIGRYAVPKEYLTHISKTAKTLENVYHEGVFKFDVEHKSTKEERPVIWADAQELLDNVVEYRNLIGHCNVKITADGGQGFLKVCMSVFPRKSNIEEIDPESNEIDSQPKKRTLYSEGGTCSNQNKLTSVTLVPFVSAFKAMDKIVQASFSTEKLYENKLEKYINDLNTAFKATGISQTLKIHVLLSHLRESLSILEDGLGLWSEQSGESAHREFLKHWEKYKRKANESDSVWFYFLIEKDSGQTAKCRRWQAILKTKGGSTKGLITHLKVHKIDLLDKRLNQSQDGPSAGTSKMVEVVGNNPPSKQKKKYFLVYKNDKSFEAIVARMTAVDGLPFSIFINSSDLRQLLKARGFHVPKSRYTIKTNVMRYFEKNRNNTVEEIYQLKTKGLVRLKNSLTATAIVEYLEKRLLAFQLNLSKDIVAVTTDGASTMVKVGKLITPMQQLCFAHGIQLAVIDVLYKKDGPVPPPTSSTYFKEDPNFSDSEAEIEYEDCEETGNMDMNDRIEVCENNDFLELSNDHDLYILISRIRKTSRMFRKSPTKNDLLQKQIRNDHVKELNL
ncbi:unnamed protein product [Brassicogethes aeneus]|uniref:Uncharacterized protein n=1 Tax=Brassicogethes aeneus TaxID=1431903 RepID=A0A9P0BDT7_BRAAE|nr:unnamed protein product [Brassicogethes aeneus]